MLFFFLQMHKVFWNRWDAFNSPVMAAAFMLHREFVQREVGEREDKDLAKVIKELAKAPGSPSATEMTAEYAAMQIAIKVGSHQLHDEVREGEPGAFTAQCMGFDMHVWIRTFYKPWPALMWLALKVVLLPCSAAACEHSWSIEDWIHSKRRNRLGQAIVERLVRTHTNLQLELRLELEKLAQLPWDIEMVIEEPLSEDEGQEEAADEDESDDSDSDA
jgi:hypothetical protein